MSEEPTSLDGTLINAVEPIPKPYRQQFLDELRDANLQALAQCFEMHWKGQQ